MNSPILLALLALILLGLSSAFAKKPTDKIGATKVMIFRGLFNVVILGVILIFNFPSSFSWTDLPVAILISALGYFPLLFFLKALKVGKMGIVSPVSSSYGLITALLAVVFYHEKLNGLQLFGILAVVIGIILVSINFRDFKNSHLFDRQSGIGLALLAALLWGIYFFLIKIPTQHFGTYFTSFLVEAVILISALVSLIFAKEFDLKLPDRMTASYLFLVSITVSVGVLFFYQALNTGSVAIVSAIGSSTPLIVTLYGAIFMKERLKLQQYCGMAIILIGIIGLAVTK
ncbi:MAG: EamA family transporter [Patescibacteria group bacterium]|jgi:uncharacterized membrane protein